MVWWISKKTQALSAESVSRRNIYGVALIPKPRPRPPLIQAAKDDNVVHCMALCSWSLARTVELIDTAGLILSHEAASDPCFKMGDAMSPKLTESANL